MESHKFGERLHSTTHYNETCPDCEKNTSYNIRCLFAYQYYYMNVLSQDLVWSRRFDNILLHYYLKITCLDIMLPLMAKSILPRTQQMLKNCK